MQFNKMIEEFERNTDYYEYTECSKEEADKLAEDGVKIIEEDNKFYKAIPKYSDEEYLRILKILQVKDINTIKNCILFFTIIMAICIVITVLSLLN